MKPHINQNRLTLPNEMSTQLVIQDCEALGVLMEAIDSICVFDHHSESDPNVVFDKMGFFSACYSKSWLFWNLPTSGVNKKRMHAAVNFMQLRPFSELRLFSSVLRLYFHSESKVIRIYEWTACFKILISYDIHFEHYNAHDNFR